MNHLILVGGACMLAILVAVVWRLKYSKKAQKLNFDKSKVEEDE